MRAALERAGYTGVDALLVVAVSGGPDSMSLLHALLRLKESAGLRLHVAHLDHDFRGEEAKEDARFVSRAAGELGLPATVEEADPVAYQRRMGLSSFEEAAREVRYNFLARLCGDVGASAVALGHTADDLAETVLMHIIRGSGVHGLRGMSELSSWQGRSGSPAATLFRPLLEATKQETASYCHERGIVFREDSGNSLPRFTRNRVRHDLMPALAGYNPRVRDALLRLSRSAALEVDYLEMQVAGVWDAIAGWEGESLVMDSAALASLHPLMQRMVMRRAYGELAGSPRRLEESHLKAMEALIPGPSGRALELPGGLRLHAAYGQLVLSPGPDIPCPFPPVEGEQPILLPVPAGAGVSPSGDGAIIHIPGWRIDVRHLPAPSAMSDIDDDPFTAYFDPEAIGGDIRVRARMPGDRFHPLGMQRDKKLQDFYTDQKVPRAWRDRVPLLLAGGGIAWVVGYRIAEWAKVKEDSRRVCRVQFSRENLSLDDDES